MKYALITINASRQFSGNHIILIYLDLEEAIRFLDAAKGRLQGKADAVFLCQVAQAEKKLQLGQHHDCFEILNGVKKSLEVLSDVDPKVYAHMSRAYATYYRRKEDYENFYKSSLQFLAYTPSSELTQEDNKDWSIKLGMAILLGKNIYNIMELVCISVPHPYYSLTKKSFTPSWAPTSSGCMRSSTPWAEATSVNSRTRSTCTTSTSRASQTS